jgi:hypothetical protein
MDIKQKQADADEKFRQAQLSETIRSTKAGEYLSGQNVAEGGSVSQTAQEQTPYSQERSFRTLPSVQELSPRVGIDTVGPLAVLSARIPGTPAYDFKSEIETLKSNIAFGELTAMREASKTGGALGQVSDTENKLLSASLGSLDQGQSPENFKRQLEKIKASLQRWDNAVSANTKTVLATGTLLNGTKVTKYSDGTILDEKGNSYDESGKKI